MITKNELKYYSSLTQKKYRKLEERFIAEGEKIILEGLKSNHKCEKIFCTNQFKEDNIGLINNLKKSHSVEILSPHDFLRLSDTVSPQEIAAVFLLPNSKFDLNKKHSDYLIFLENISDPGNVGTIIRNCDWFGIKEIMLNKECADVYNPKTIRSTAGSLFHLSIYEELDLKSTLTRMKESGYKILTADTRGKNLQNYSFKGKNIIVFGNEANGPSEELLGLSNEQITIPRFGKAESLNVANAAAVILSLIKIKKSI